MSIKCQVEECAYNRHQMCQAQNIQVMSSGDLHVSEPEGTCCLTFKSLK